MKINLNDITRQFILNEGETPTPTLTSYVQALSEILNRLTPRTVREQNDLSIAKQHLHEIRRNSRKLMEKISILEEQVKLLEEQTKR